MRFIVQVRIEPDTDTTGDIIDVAIIERDVLSLATLGLSIEDANLALTGIQKIVVTEHCAEALSTVEHCEECGRRFAHKDNRQLQVRSLYGKLTVPEPEMVDLHLQQSTTVDVHATRRSAARANDARARAGRSQTGCSHGVFCGRETSW